MTTNLKVSLEKLEDLVTNKNNANLEIIKSHTLEILLSMSSDPAFLSEVEHRPKLLEAFIHSLDVPALRHKILLLFVNISAEKNLANKLVELTIVRALYQILFDAMKRINPEHLDVTDSLLVDKTEKEKLTLEEKNGGNVEEKTFEISQSKIKKADQLKMLDLDTIRLSIMILMNCSLFSNTARVEILGIDTESLTETEEKPCKDIEEKLRNLKIVIDWVRHERVGHLFKNFIFVLTNISSDPELRSLLVEHSLPHFTALFEFQEKQKTDFDSFLQLCQIFRNFSFEYENPKLKDAFADTQIIGSIAKTLEESEFTLFQKNRLKLILVDLLWVFHTNIDFCKSDTPLAPFRYDGDKKQLEEWIKDEDLLALAEANPDSCDIKEKLQGLDQIFLNYSN